MKRILGLLIVLLMIGLIPQEALALKWGGILNITSVKEPRNLNPVYDRSNEAKNIYNLIYSGLAKADESGQWLPDLLTHIPTLENEGVQIQDTNEMIVTYVLRENIRWHDNQKLTSEDVQFTWQMHIDPRINYPPTPGYNLIRHIEPLDARTIRVYFKEVYPDYLTLFQEILPKHAFRNRIVQFGPSHPFNRRPVGSGPFRYSDWQKGKHLILNANKNYHLSRAYLDQIRYHFQSQDFTQLPRAVDLVDKSHVVQGLSILSYDYLKQLKGIQVHSTPADNIEHLDFNLTNPFLADIRVRRAIAYAIDKGAIKRLFSGLIKPAYSDQIKTSWKYNHQVESFYPFNIARAKELLAQAGWFKSPETDWLVNKNGDILEFTLTTIRGNQSHIMTGQYIKRALRRIGMNIKLETVPAQVLFNRVLPASDGKGFEIALNSWYSGINADSYSRWHSKMLYPLGRNYTRFNDYKVDDILQKIRLSANFQNQKQLYLKLAELIAERLPSLPLYYNPHFEVSKLTLHNFRPNVYQGATWNSYEWWLE